MMALSKQIKHLPTMNDVKDIQEQLSNYTKAETYAKFSDEI